jgi:hypothetical protein
MAPRPGLAAHRFQPPSDHVKTSTQREGSTDKDSFQEERTAAGFRPGWSAFGLIDHAIQRRIVAVKRHQAGSVPATNLVTGP